MPPSMFGLTAEAALWSVSLVCGAGGWRSRSFAFKGYSMQEVARRLGRVASTISRELRRNAATRSGGIAGSVIDFDSAMARRARCSPPKSMRSLRATRR